MTREGDVLLTLDALSRIVQVMQDGSLSPDLSITRYPTQVVVQARSFAEIGEADREALSAMFSGPKEEKASARAVWPRGFTGKRTKATLKDSYSLVIDLRPKDLDAPSWRPDVPPRIEVWGIYRPHACTRFTGYLDPSGKPRWRCADYGCKQVMGIRAARAKGLTP